VEVINTFTHIVGEPYVLIGSGLEDYTTDWRKRTLGKALAVVLPGNTQEVAKVVKVCIAHNIPIVPQGGNTGLVLGGIPDNSGRQLILSLKRLHHIRNIDVANACITVEAGCTLISIQVAAKKAQWFFPLSMGSEGSCTIGGNLATNAGGTQVLRYGTTRDLCLGLEIVTPQGEVLDDLSALRKDNTGYDLRHLLIGSEGTLGIITAASLKLFPLPKTKSHVWLALTDTHLVLDLLVIARQRLGTYLSAFEVMNTFSLKLVRKHYPEIAIPLLSDGKDYPWYVLLEVSDTTTITNLQPVLQAFLEDTLKDSIVSDIAIAQNLQQSQHFWKIRESIPLAQSREGLNVKHDIALPSAQIPIFVTQTDLLLSKEFRDIRIVNYGHWGDGNLHYNIQCPEGTDPKTFLAEYETNINQMVYAQVAKYRGSISAEHGIGGLKRRALQGYKSPVALAMMRTIKKALDPKNILNPGRVL
jgi:FAD/FMN-containing dehydrogenase